MPVSNNVKSENILTFKVTLKQIHMTILSAEKRVCKSLNERK